MMPLWRRAFGTVSETASERKSQPMSDENSRYLKRRRHRREKIGKLLTRLEKAETERLLEVA